MVKRGNPEGSLDLTLKVQIHELNTPVWMCMRPFSCRSFLRYAPHGMIYPRQSAEFGPVHHDEYVHGKTTDWKAFKLAGQDWTFSEPVQEHRPVHH